MKRFVPLLIAALAGAFTVFAYAPFGVSPLIFFSLAVLFTLWRDATIARAALLGLSWGTGAFFAGIGWLIVALNRFGGMPLPLAGLAILLFATFLALYPALAGAAFARLRGASVWRNTALLAAVWTLGEYLRGWVFTGFPWLAVGYSQTPPSPLAGFAPVFGVYGIGFLVALAAAALALAPRNRRGVLSAAALVVLLAATGAALRTIAWTAPVGAPVRIALVQTAIPQDMKWDRERLIDVLALNASLMGNASAQLVVLPETTVPILSEQLPEGYLASISETLRRKGAEGVLGVFTRGARGGISNSAISLGKPEGQTYSKNHLVPFGEYAPPLFGWFYTLAHIPMSNQTGGGREQPLMDLAGQKIAINICYEDLFGEELLHWLPEASLMLNMSNLAWYGDSHAQPQHLQIARIRALETGRPMLRSTNTGMTGWVQPDGSVAAVLPAFVRDTLVVKVRGYAGLTPYARWGNLPVLLLAAGILAFAAWRRRA